MHMIQIKPERWKIIGYDLVEDPSGVFYCRHDRLEATPMSRGLAPREHVVCVSSASAHWLLWWEASGDDQSTLRDKLFSGSYDAADRVRVNGLTSVGTMTYHVTCLALPPLR